MTQEEKTKLLNVLKNFDNISTYIFDLLSPISKMREKYSCTEEEACNMKLQAEDYLSKYGCLTIDATNKAVKKMIEEKVIPTEKEIPVPIDMR